MARDLKSILNQRIRLSITIVEEKFDQQFANGYLLGEMLFKFGLQPDFPFIRNSDDTETKIHNFSRILPALEDIGMKVSISEVVKVMNAEPGSSALLVYHALKALEVLPIKNPRWNIDTAEKFRRKGSWADFTASSNIDFETFTKLDTKYQIPGEERCRYFQSALTEETERVPATEDHALPLQRAEPGSEPNHSNWRLIVQKELDDFDNKNHSPITQQPKHGSTQPLTPTIASPIQNQASSILPNRSQLSPTPESKRPVKSAESVQINQTPAPNPSQIRPVVSDAEFVREVTAGIQITEPSATELPPFSPNDLTDYIPAKRKRSKQSLIFHREEYLQNIRRKAEERRKRKISAAKEEQERWLATLTEKRRQREQETEIAAIQRINTRIERDKKIALTHLTERRQEFDKKVLEVKFAENLDHVRQMEYVKSMLNQGFWDLLGGDALNMENLQEWCRKAQIPFNEDFYHNLCKNYSFCKDLLKEYYKDNFVKAFEQVSIDEGDTRFPLKTDPSTIPAQETTNENADSLTTETPDEEPTSSDREELRVTDQPALFWEDQELAQYQEITRQFRYEHLSWMQRFIDPSKITKRNLGHIISCVVNDPTWRSPPEQVPKFPTKFISILITGRRSSLLKKTILTKLAMTYNLEIISVADLIHEAVDAALSLQAEVPEVKDPKAAPKRRMSKGPIKKVSVSKLRGKTKSVAASASVLNTGFISPNSQKGEFSKRLLRSLSEDGTIDSGLVIDLIEQAIDTHVVHPVPKAADPFNDAISIGTTSTKKGRSESKSRTEENNPNREKPAEDLQPFGWVITDLPLSIELLQLLEHRLGGCSLDTHPHVWHSSELIRDDFGPKPKEFSKSFFSAILCVDCPDENEILHPDKHSEPPPPEEDRTLGDTLQQNITKAKSKHVSPHPPTGTVQEDTDEVFNPIEIKRHLGEFLSALETMDEIQWKSVEKFYSTFLMKVFGRLANWKNPEETFGLITKTVEEVMETNTIKHTDGVTFAVQQQLNQAIRDVCSHVWEYRTAVRKEIAEQMLGSTLAASAIHYLLKQDIKLIRDVYCKCQAQLYQIARKRQGMRHDIGIALYRRTTFPLKYNEQYPIYGHDRDNPQTPSFRRGSSPRNGPIYDASCVHEKKHHNIDDIEKELIRIKRGPSDHRCRPETAPLTPEERNFLQEWTEHTVSSLKEIPQRHRCNELVLSVIDLHPSNPQSIVYDFPYLNTDKFLQIQEAWKTIEEEFFDKISRIIPTMNMVDLFLSQNTKRNQNLFQTALDMPNTISKSLIHEYVVSYDKHVEIYPEIQSTEVHKRKLKELYRKLCKFADYRHAARHDFLRDLMKNSGYTDVILQYRNAYNALITAEVLLFQDLTNFVVKCYNTVLELPHSASDSHSDFHLPAYAVTEEQTQRAQEILRQIYLEAPLHFCLGMACGSFQQELNDFLDIISDDQVYWEQVLQIVRYFLDQTAEKAIKNIYHLAKDKHVDNSPSDPSEIPPEPQTAKNEGLQIPGENGHERKFSDFPEEANISPKPPFPTRFTQNSQSDDKSSTEPVRSWFEEFKKYDYDEFISTVKHDIMQRQKVFEKPLPRTNSPNFLSDHEEEAEAEMAMRRERKMKKIVTETINQEVEYAMLKICRIAVACVRKCEMARNTAKDMFYVMDHWLQETHTKEQKFADEFYETALSAVNSSEPLIRNSKIKEVLKSAVF